MSAARFTVVALLGLTLAACASQREVRVLDDLDGASVPRDGVTREEASEDVAALPPRPLPTPEEIAAAPDPLSLKGEAAEAVTAAFGPATLLRREPPAQVWQYRGRTCVLDVVLYPDETEGAPLTVAHVELRPWRRRPP